MASEEPSPSLPSVTTTSHPDHDQDQERSSTSSSSSSVHEDGGLKRPRPKMTSRKSSGTIIVPREHPRVELQEGDEVFDEDDARAMSPRRSSQDLEKMSQDAREHLNEYVCSIPLLSHIQQSTLLNFKLKNSTDISKTDTPKFSSSLSSKSSTESKP
jgi:hypothetical protein